MRWLSAILIALLLVSPLYELKVANANLNLPYLANYTPPSVIKAQLGGLYVSGGGLYLRSRYVYQPPLIQFERPRFNVGCGSIDAFLGALGFSGFDWLVARLQQFLMAAPYVIFKAGLAVLLPQLDSILSAVEGIINQLNSLQIDQCGRITGLDVNLLKEHWETLTKAFSRSEVDKSSQGRDNVILSDLRRVGDAIRKGNLIELVNSWNDFVNRVWSDYYRIAGVSVGPNEPAFSLVEKTHERLRSLGISPYMSNTGCLYIGLVGDVWITNSPSLANNNQQGQGLPPIMLPRTFATAGAQDVDRAMEAIVAYLKGAGSSRDKDRAKENGSSQGEDRAKEDGSSQDKERDKEVIPSISVAGGTRCPSQLPLSSLWELNALRADNLESSLRAVYDAILYRRRVSENDAVVRVLASIPNFPALAYIQWAAIADGTGGSSEGRFFGEAILREASKVLGTYAACMVLTQSLSYLHAAVVRNLNDLYVTTCSKTVRVGDRTQVEASEYCKNAELDKNIFNTISFINNQYTRVITRINGFCEEVKKQSKSNIEAIRGLAEEAEREARKRLSVYGVQLRGAIIWDSR
ncbi:MAG: conjugal transfer protein TraH [Thermofilaceae archaeon]